MILEAEPYISYYNETTVNWDLILEPFRVKSLALLSPETFRVSLICGESININLPAAAVSQYIKLANEIKMSMKSNDTPFSEFPHFWLENQLFEDISIHSTVQEEAFFVLNPGVQLPVFGVDMDHPLVLGYGDQTYEFSPRYIIYPRFLSQGISIVKKPYRGGVMISFQSPVQIRNHLQTGIDIYARQQNNFRLYRKLAPGACCPVWLEPNAADDFLFTEENSQSRMKHAVISLNRSMTGKLVVPIDIGGRAVKIFLIFEIDCSTATRFITMMAPVIGVSLFPVPLTVQLEGERLALKQGEPSDLLSVPFGASKIKGSFSLDIDHVPVADKISLSFKKITSGRLYDAILNRMTHLAILSEQDDATEQVTLSFFAPVVFFNLTELPLTITEGGVRDPLQLTVFPECFLCWCTESYINNNAELKVHVHVSDQSGQSNLLDCSTSRTGTMFLPVSMIEGLCYGIRYDITLKNRIACVTFAHLVVVDNLLPGIILLQPILEVPKIMNATDENRGLAALAEPIGPPVVLAAGKQSVLPMLSECCSVVFTFHDIPSTPILGLGREQRTVFAVFAGDRMMLIELEIVDIGTQFHAYLRQAPFPTPFVIANFLPVALTAYHTSPRMTFVVPPFATTRFAYDEPMGYPAIHFSFDDQRLHISLIEDTDFIMTPAICDAFPVFVSIKQMTASTRAVYVTSEVPSPRPLFGLDLRAALSHINISFIDLRTREFALLNISGVALSIERESRALFIDVSVESLQLDDQSPDASRPTAIAGRSVRGFPFARLQLALPPEPPFLSEVLYAALTVQRLDIELDSAFLSDIYYLTAELGKPMVWQITARAPRPDGGRILPVRWLEVSPIYAVFKYRRSGRAPGIRGFIPGIKFVPVIEGRLVLPGVIVAHVSDALSDIREKIAGEYKTAAFFQIIETLGGRGKLMSAFGVTTLIAQALGVKLTTELSGNASAFAGRIDEEFDNRRDLGGCFAEETLESIAQLMMEHSTSASPVLEGLCSGADVGLKLRASGLGVFGILTRTSIDTARHVGLMEGLSRRREPRAFIENQIGPFDPWVSQAQLFVQKGLAHEKLRMVVRLGDSALCCTDQWIFIADLALRNVTTKVPIVALEMQVEETRLALTLNFTRNGGASGKIEIECTDRDQLEVLKVFLASQKVMIEMFKASLI
jgi:hypothetical protein